MDYNRRPNFERHVEDLLNLATTVEAHGGLLTIQAQTAFTTSAIRFGNSILSDFEDRGHEIGLHFRESVHLGDGDEDLPAEIWTTVMQEEIELIHRAGVEGPTRYWSGGNLYPQVLQAAAGADLSINSDWKNPNSQSTPQLLMGIHPWRPAGGTDGKDEAASEKSGTDAEVEDRYSNQETIAALGQIRQGCAGCNHCSEKKEEPRPEALPETWSLQSIDSSQILPAGLAEQVSSFHSSERQTDRACGPRPYTAWIQAVRLGQQRTSFPQ